MKLDELKSIVESANDPFAQEQAGLELFDLADEIIALVEAVNYGPDDNRNLKSLCLYLDGIHEARHRFNAKLSSL